MVLPGTLTGPAPTVAGTAQVGATLTANTGAWGPAPVEPDLPSESTNGSFHLRTRQTWPAGSVPAASALARGPHGDQFTRNRDRLHHRIANLGEWVAAGVLTSVDPDHHGHRPGRQHAVRQRRGLGTDPGHARPLGESPAAPPSPVARDTDLAAHPCPRTRRESHLCEDRIQERLRPPEPRPRRPPQPSFPDARRPDPDHQRHRSRRRHPHRLPRNLDTGPPDPGVPMEVQRRQ